MKSFLALVLLFTTLNASASRLARIKVLTDPQLDQAAKTIANTETTTHFGNVRVVTLRAAGKTIQEQREKTIEQAVKGLCKFFDDGAEMSLNAKGKRGSETATRTYIDGNYSNSDQDGQTVYRALLQANNLHHVEIYSGSAGGNNTFGTVLGIYDTKNNEIAVFASTNCGSDN